MQVHKSAEESASHKVCECPVLAQREYFKRSTILDKTTQENVFINAHYLTQQNYFQINGFAWRKPPPLVQSCFLQMPNA